MAPLHRSTSRAHVLSPSGPASRSCDRDRTKGCWRENPDQPLVREDQKYVLYLTFAGLAVHVADDYCPVVRRPDNPIIVPYPRLAPFMLPGPWRDELLARP